MYSTNHQVTRSMQEHLKEVIDFKQFTILVPTDSMFEAMSPSELHSLKNDQQKRKQFLKQHIFIGEIGGPNEMNKAIGYSISAEHSVITGSVDENDTQMLVDASDRLFQVVKSRSVSEGQVHIVQNVK